jgi:hypothetical protein
MMDRRNDRGDDSRFDAQRSQPGSNAGTVLGPLWLIGWLFTIGYAQLSWWQALLALVIWPYFLGVMARGG